MTRKNGLKVDNLNTFSMPITAYFQVRTYTMDSDSKFSNGIVNRRQNEKREDAS